MFVKKSIIKRPPVEIHFHYECLNIVELQFFFNRDEDNLEMKLKKLFKNYNYY